MLEGILVDLVPFASVYQDQMVHWLNGPLRDWWSQDGLQSRAAQQRVIQGFLDNPPDNFIPFGVQTKNGDSIGMFSLFNLNPYHRTAELSAGISDPAYWGGGYGSDATLLIVEYAFRWLDVRRLFLTTLETNLRAQRQVEKCGFVREGARRQAMRYQGRPVNHQLYGMLREEWPGREVMVERLKLREKAGKQTV